MNAEYFIEGFVTETCYFHGHEYQGNGKWVDVKPFEFYDTEEACKVAIENERELDENDDCQALGADDYRVASRLARDRSKPPVESIFFEGGLGVFLGLEGDEGEAASLIRESVEDFFFWGQPDLHSEIVNALAVNLAAALSADPDLPHPKTQKMINQVFVMLREYGIECWKKKEVDRFDWKAEKQRNSLPNDVFAKRGCDE